MAILFWRHTVLTLKKEADVCMCKYLVEESWER